MLQRLFDRINRWLFEERHHIKNMVLFVVILNLLAVVLNIITPVYITADWMALNLIGAVSGWLLFKKRNKKEDAL